MKKRMIFTIGLLVTLSLCSCGKKAYASHENETSEPEKSTGYFRVLSNEFGDLCPYGYGNVIYDARTGVEYWLSNGTYNSGSIYPLIDADGNPLIFEGYDK